MKYSVRSHCRICDSDRLAPLLTFPDYPMSDNFLGALGDEAEQLLPYQAHLCRDCGVVQNLMDLDWSSYYADYDYTTSSSGFARRFMKQVADNIHARYLMPRGTSVLEIGSGDGDQLAEFQHLGFRVQGIEPGETLALQASNKGIATHHALFSKEALGNLPSELFPVGLYLSFYTFDHLPDPLEFLRSVADTIDRQHGLLVIEVHDLDEIIRRREACLFCHEHTIYPSACSLTEMLHRAGLKPLSTSLVPDGQRRGNSLLMVAAHHESQLKPDLSVPPPLDPAINFAHLFDLSRNVEVAFSNLGRVVRQWIEQGVTIAGYGASARSISSLALAGLTHKEISYICDANKKLHGRMLPKSHVPVRSPSHAIDYPVDRMIVFAYGYMDEISGSLRPCIAKGMKLISLLDLLNETTPDPE